MSATPFFTKSKLAMALTITALPLAVMPLTATAQSDQAAAERRSPAPGIEVIRVTGNQQGHAYVETGTVTLIDLEQIQAIQPLSTEDVLRRIPGVNIKGEEETSIVANFGLRGLSASESKSLLLEDGVPVAPGLFIGNDRYFNTRIQRVEQVEILKGSSSLRYGPSTIGGVVNYISKTPDDGAKVSGRVGSFNLREMNIEAGGRNVSGDAYAGVVATYADSDGFMDKGYKMSDVMLKAGTAIGNNQRVGVKFSFHENDANISYRGILLDEYRAGADRNPAPDDWYLQERQAVDLNHEWLISDSTTLKTLFYWSDVSRDYWRYSVDTPASNVAGRWVYTDALTGNNRSFERLGAETRLSIAHAFGGLTADTEFGFRAMTEESNDIRIRATRQQDRSGTNDRHRVDSADSVAVYVQSRIELTERLALTPGLRVEDYEQTRLFLTQNNATATTSNAEFLPGVGVTFDVTPAAQIYGGVYRAFSPASNGVALDGLTDQNLDGERSTNYELGIRGAEGPLSYEVAAFAMDFSNQVVTGNSDPNLSRSNAGETEHYGMEFATGYDFGGGFSVDSNATWIPTSEFKTGDFQGNRLPYAPKVLANVGLNYSVDRLQAALTAHHRGEQYGDPSNQMNLPAGAGGGIWGGLLPAYTVVDLTAQYNIADGFDVFGAVKNIADKKYIAGLRQGIYVGPERSVEVGFRYGF